MISGSSIVKGRYKGLNGKVGVIGGSFEYTGAPFYAAISSTYAGGDLSHIFCHEQAAVPIKSYSPEVIVHPTLNKKTPEATTIWLSALHSLAIGPGLGRTEDFLDELTTIIASALDHMFDGDFFWYLMLPQAEKLRATIYGGAQYCVLTPNKAEFKRMVEYFLKSKPEEMKALTSESVVEVGLKENSPLSELCNKMNGITIIQKGPNDMICNGKRMFFVGQEGSKKRCGGQGDVLSGCTALFCYYAKVAAEEKAGSFSDEILYACAGACMLTRAAAKLGYDKKKRGLTTPTIMKKVGPAFQTLFGE